MIHKKYMIIQPTLQSSFENVRNFCTAEFGWKVRPLVIPALYPLKLIVVNPDLRDFYLEPIVSCLTCIVFHVGPRLRAN